MRIRCSLFLAACLTLPASLHAQHATRDSTIATAVRADVDSVTLNPKLNLRSQRALARLKSRSDSLRSNAGTAFRVDTLRLVRVDTVRVAVTPDTTVVVPPPIIPPVVPPPVVVDSNAPPTVSFSHPFAPPSNGAVLAELPRDTVPVAYPTITRRIAVVNLQQAVDTAKAGDELLVNPGTTTANVSVKTSDVVIRANVPDSLLGGQWSKMTKARADALNLPTITTSTNTPALWILSNTHHVRVVGIRFATTGTVGNSLVWVGNGENTLAAIPHHVTLDRILADGGTADIRRCIRGDAAYFALISSTGLNCHSNNDDSQGLLVINSPGPIRVENNTLQGGHQAIMFGGGDPAAPNVLPRDFVIRGNTLCRPIAWLGVWKTKTIVEFKIGERGLVEGNTICNVWPNGQSGMAVNLKTVNQGGAATWAHTGDVTIRWNKFVCASGVFSIFDRPDNTNPAIPTSRITIYGNRADSIAVAPCLASTDGLTLSGVNDVVFVRNWIANPGGRAAIYANGTSQRFVATDNVFGGQYGLKGDGVTFSTLVPGALLTNNVLVPWGTTLGGWPIAPVDTTRDGLLGRVTP